MKSEDSYNSVYLNYKKRFSTTLTPSVRIGIASPGALISVVIPCFAEPDLNSCLESLLNCEDPGCVVNVFVILNDSEDSDPHECMLNEKTLERFKSKFTSAQPDRFIFIQLIYFSSIRSRHAGVGLARKLGMDESLKYALAEPSSIILNLDADCRVRPDYLKAVFEYFKENSSCATASIYYEHELKGLSREHLTAICEYEIKLRYQVRLLRLSGYPHAYQTVGSAMVVRAFDYMKQGGMNRKKAGEDFYFLNKMMRLGNFGEINTTVVYPSARVSDRVPFGTGKAISERLKEKEVSIRVYPPASFEVLKEFISLLPELFKQTTLDLDSVLSGRKLEILNDFLANEDFEGKLTEMKTQSTFYDSFAKRFYQWFDGLKVIRMLHYLCDEGFREIPVEEGVEFLIHQTGFAKIPEGLGEILEILRKLDQNEKQ